jgi:hypothetical protein
MAKRVTKNKPVISEEVQIKSYVEYLRNHGYSVFRLEDCNDIEEAESIRKLQLSGYKIEHIKDSMVKIDANNIASADDIALYFFEKLRRLDSRRVDSYKLTDPKARRVDCSVVNSFIKWRTDDNSISLTQAIEELFMVIDVMFARATEWSLDIYSMGILSIVHNKPFVMSLLREVHVVMDQRLNYNTSCLVKSDDEDSYSTMLEMSKAQMTKIVKAKPGPKRKIKIGDTDAQKGKEK